jgi:hypothetical protein
MFSNSLIKCKFFALNSNYTCTNEMHAHTHKHTYSHTYNTPLHVRVHTQTHKNTHTHTEPMSLMFFHHGFEIMLQCSNHSLHVSKHTYIHRAYYEGHSSRTWTFNTFCLASI